ncbi:nitrogen regulation protein NR(II) [Psychrobacillus sp. NPDC058041]|uniref:two-component system sensor histidine kinase NtrB n=1 Tax=Psychrobacillus sp. NPDC058041 TaxID=3346310 RepID=UPI0036DB4AF0
METKSFIKKRNQLFIGISVIFTCIHLITSLFLPDSKVESFIFYEVIYILLLIILFIFNSRIHSVKYQYIILAFLNLYSLFINLHNSNIVFLVFLIYPIYASILYRNILPRIILLIATISEVALLIFFKEEAYYHYFTVNDLILLIIFLVLIVQTSIANSIMENKSWKKLSEQNNSMLKELNSREGYLQLFFDYAKDAIAVFDLNNNIIEVNHAFEEMYGWKREELIGQCVCFVPPENREVAELRYRDVLNGVSYHCLETQDMKKDGTYFDVQITLSPIYDYNGKLIALSAISRDISYKKEAEKILVQSEKLKIAGEMAAGVAHEIRNPMTVVSGFIQMMNEDKEQPYYEYTKLIQSEIERINYIMSEFLILAKPHITERKKYNFNHTLDNIILLFEPELHLKGITLSLETSSKDIFLFGEENQMKQVLINVLKNAIEAIIEDGYINITYEDSRSEVMSLKISDNGSGMDSSIVEKLFDPFFTTKEKGTGLGMMISKKIITEYGGNISIESELGKGTTVAIQIPYKEV